MLPLLQELLLQVPHLSKQDLARLKKIKAEASLHSRGAVSSDKVSMVYNQVLSLLCIEMEGVGWLPINPQLSLKAKMLLAELNGLSFFDPEYGPVADKALKRLPLLKQALIDKQTYYNVGELKKGVEDAFDSQCMKLQSAHKAVSFLLSQISDVVIDREFQLTVLNNPLVQDKIAVITSHVIQLGVRSIFQIRSLSQLKQGQLSFYVSLLLSQVKITSHEGDYSDETDWLDEGCVVDDKERLERIRILFERQNPILSFFKEYATGIEVLNSQPDELTIASALWCLLNDKFVSEQHFKKAMTTLIDSSGQKPKNYARLLLTELVSAIPILQKKINHQMLQSNLSVVIPKLFNLALSPTESPSCFEVDKKLGEILSILESLPQDLVSLMSFRLYSHAASTMASFLTNRVQYFKPRRQQLFAKPPLLSLPCWNATHAFISLFSSPANRELCVLLSDKLRKFKNPRCSLYADAMELVLSVSDDSTFPIEILCLLYAPESYPNDELKAVMSTIINNNAPYADLVYPGSLLSTLLTSIPTLRDKIGTAQLQHKLNLYLPLLFKAVLPKGTSVVDYFFRTPKDKDYKDLKPEVFDLIAAAMSDDQEIGSLAQVVRQLQKRAPIQDLQVNNLKNFLSKMKSKDRDTGREGLTLSRILCFLAPYAGSFNRDDENIILIAVYRMWEQDEESRVKPAILSTEGVSLADSPGGGVHVSAKL